MRGKIPMGLAAGLLLVVCGNGSTPPPTATTPTTTTTTAPQAPTSTPNLDPLRQLVGYPEVNGYAGAPLNDHVWKTFRVRAEASGSADIFRAFLWGFASGRETDNEVGYAVYEDNNGTIGPLKVSGYVPNYDWTVVGNEKYHLFLLDTVHTDRTITEGDFYWLVFQASGGENVLISRGRESTCDDNLKRGTNAGSVDCCEVPPTPQELSSLTYNSGCYGWAVWQSAGSS